jgi:1-acyl-sn-glycerol-3-phosphate acyltransferase
MSMLVRQVLEPPLRALVALFFRTLEVSGLEHVSRSGPAIFVLNHPNALIDPLVLLCRSPRPVAFLAKEPLFRMPIIGTIVRGMDSIPVYRRQDQADMAKNRLTFAAARALLARGGSVALFPEGTSHSEPSLRPFRTGAARIALGAASDGGLEVIPAGLFYTAKAAFRSQALLCFGPAIRVAPVPPGPDGEPPVEPVRELTRRLEEALRALTPQADRHEALRLVEITEAITTSAVPELERDLADRLQVRQRLLAGYSRLKAVAPERLAALENRVTRFQAALSAQGLTPELLPVRGYRPARVVRLALRTAMVLIVLLPAALLGIGLHAPGYFLIRFVSGRFGKRWPDVEATVKILAGVLIYGLTWSGLAAVGWLAAGPWGALAAMVAGPLSGLIAVGFLERLQPLLGGARGVLLALTGRRRFLRLTAERRAIREELLRVAKEYGV